MTLIAKRVYELSRMQFPKGTMLIPVYDPATGKDYYAFLQDVVAESTYNTWDPTITYQVGDRVTWQFRLWESVKNPNLNIPPSEGADWREVSPDSVAAVPADIDLQSARFDTDFLMTEARLGFVSWNNGGGLGASGYSNFGMDSVENAMGVAKVSTASSTAGGGTIYSGIQGIVFGSGFSHVLRMRNALEILSDASDSYIAYAGFLSTTGTGTGGASIFFRYTHSVNGGRWQAVCNSAGSETAEDTGVAADVNTFHKFEIFVNPDGTSVDFYIDGVKTNTITTNIPGAGQFTSFMIKIEKTAGANSRSFYCDYIQYIPTRTLPR